jgi:hypothetical protein
VVVTALALATLAQPLLPDLLPGLLRGRAATAAATTVTTAGTMMSQLGLFDDTAATAGAYAAPAAAALADGLAVSPAAVWAMCVLYRPRPR